jgi:hypothetical protein
MPPTPRNYAFNMRRIYEKRLPCNGSDTSVVSGARTRQNLEGNRFLQPLDRLSSEGSVAGIQTI